MSEKEESWFNVKTQRCPICKKDVEYYDDQEFADHIAEHITKGDVRRAEREKPTLPASSLKEQAINWCRKQMENPVLLFKRLIIGAVGLFLFIVILLAFIRLLL